jgi:hypothetical protein
MWPESPRFFHKGRSAQSIAQACELGKQEDHGAVAAWVEETCGMTRTGFHIELEAGQLESRVEGAENHAGKSSRGDPALDVERGIHQDPSGGVWKKIQPREFRGSPCLE